MQCNASSTAIALTAQISARSMEENADTLLAMKAQAQFICLASRYHQPVPDRFVTKQTPRFDFK